MFLIHQLQHGYQARYIVTLVQKGNKANHLRQQNNTEPITKPTGIVINQTELKEKISSWQQVISIQRLSRESQMSSKPGMA